MNLTARPSSHVYVIKLTPSGEPGQPTLCGRVEHVGSGRRHEFHDGASLLECLAREEVLAAQVAQALQETRAADAARRAAEAHDAHAD